jgi:TolB protein
MSGKLVFPRYAGEARSHPIFVVNADGSGLRKVAADGDEPAWAPDGTKIAYVRVADGIFVMNADGSGKRRVVSDAGLGHPRWSPNGKALVVESASSRGPALAIVDVGTGALRALRTRLDPSLPDWSPDGRRIAFTDVAFDGPDAIYVINVDGSGLRRVTRPAAGAEDMHARWSRDGARLLFYRQGPDPRAAGRIERRVYTVSASGGRPTPVFTGRVTSLSWSPDGRRIAYAGGSVGVRILVFDVRSRRHRPLRLAPCGGAGTCQSVDWR